MTAFKTGLLACLVIVSIVLAVMLMSGRPVPEPLAKSEAVWFGPEPNLHEISLPGRIYIIRPDGRSVLIETFSDMYTDLALAFSQIQYGIESGNDMWTPGEYPGESYPPGVLLRYDYLISRSLLANWLTMFYETDFPFAAVDSIYIPFDQGPVQFINTATKEAWQLQATLAWDVFERAVVEPKDFLEYSWTVMRPGENYSVTSPVYDIAQTEIMAIPSWTSEQINISAVIRSFYLEPALIQEPDGTEIYTDGLQALRVFPTGAIEYNVAHTNAESTIPGQADVIKAAVNFIASHGGWPEGMLPTSVGIHSGQRVRLEFSGFGLGLPIFVTDAGLVIEMNNLEVRTYTRDLVRLKTNEIVRYAEIKPLARLLSSLETQAAQYFASAKMTIFDSSLSYYWQNDILIPVWRVWVDRHVILIGAEDGRIYKIRTLGGGK